MSYTQVIRHIQNILNQCGDPVNLRPTGQQVMGDSLHMVIEISRVLIKKQNKCCSIPPPSPACNENPDDSYWINRIRISPSMADDYSKGSPYKDEEIKDLIANKTFLFGCQ